MQTRNPSAAPTPRRLSALLRVLVVSTALAGSLSACVPLVLGGIVGGVWLAADRRTSGAQIDDEGLEFRGNNRIGNALQGRGRVNVMSYNRIVLLTGQVATPQDRQLVEDTAKTLPNARTIVNEITIGPVTNGGPRAQDAVTSGRVKSVLVGAKDVKSNAVKVSTEAGVVYLMGIVTQQEGDRAADAASTVGGVVKVVKVFEVVSPEAFSTGTVPASLSAPVQTPTVPAGTTVQPAVRSATTP